MTSRTLIAASVMIGLVAPAIAVAGDPPAPDQGSDAKPAPEAKPADKGLEPPPPAEGSGAKPAARKVSVTRALGSNSKRYAPV